MGWLERLPAWMKLLGVIGGFLLTQFAHKLPEGLQDVGAYAGLLAMLAMVAGVGLHWWRERRRGEQVEATDLIRLGMSGAVLFSVLAIAGFVWRHYQPKGAATAAKSPLDQTIQLECTWAQNPAVIPRDGLTVVEIMGGNMGIGMMDTSFPPGAPNNAVGEAYPDQIWKCTFTNFGPQPVVNVQATFTVNFQETIFREDGMGSSSGKTVRVLQAASPLVNLGVGALNDYTFFVRNSSPESVQVIVPTTVRAQAVGKPDWQTASLIPARMGGFGLPPFFRGATTDLISAFMADVARQEPAAKVLRLKTGFGPDPLVAAPSPETSKNGFVSFFVPAATTLPQFEKLASKWDHFAPAKGVKRVIFVHESEYPHKETLTALAAHEGVIIELQGAEYLKGVISGIRSGARKAPPAYQLKGGLPVLAVANVP